MIKFYPITATFKECLRLFYTDDYMTLMVETPLWWKPCYDAYTLRTINDIHAVIPILACGLIGHVYNRNESSKRVHTMKNAWYVWLILNKNPDDFMLKALFTPYYPEQGSGIFNLVSVDVLPKMSI